jgi:hypothetical protein
MKLFEIVVNDVPRENHGIGNIVISFVCGFQSQSKKHVNLMTKQGFICGRRPLREMKIVMPEFKFLE